MEKNNDWHKFSVPVDGVNYNYFSNLGAALKAFGKIKDNFNYEIVREQDFYIIRKKDPKWTTTH